MRGDEDDSRRVAVDVLDETAGEIQTAVGTEVNVDERDLRPQLPNAPERLRGRARASDDREALTLEQFARSFAEARLVVDDEEAQGHVPRIAPDVLIGMGAGVEIDGASHGGCAASLLRTTHRRLACVC